MDRSRPTTRADDAPSGPLAALGGLIARRPWAVLVASLVAFAACVAIGVPTAGSLSLSRFEAPESESARAAQLLQQDFDTGRSNVTVVVTARSGDVDAPAAAEAGTALTEQLAGHPGVAEAFSYWTAAEPRLRSDDGSQALVLARVPGDADRVREEVLPGLLQEFERDTGAYTTAVGGGEAVFRDASSEAGADFVRAELIIVPTVFLLLLLVLRNPVTAAIPLGVGIFTMIGTLALLRPVAMVTELSTFALNIVLIMGLALGVDYCLFLIYRFREELGRGRATAEAVQRTVATAGRTVVFSGVTVAASMAMMLVLPFDFLRSFGYAGIAVVLAGIVGAVVLLPAALALLGPRATRRWWSLPPRRGAGFWAVLAERVMRRPVLYGATSLVLLLALAAPALGLRLGLPDETALPEHSPARQAQEQIAEGFTAEAMDDLQVVALDARPADAEVAGHAARLSQIDGVLAVNSAAGTFVDGAPGDGPSPDRYTSPQGATWRSVVPSAERLQADPFGLVAEVRAAEAPYEVAVGGYPADLVDYRDSLLERLPLLLALVLGSTVVVLFLLTGSVLIPLKATVLNLATLGVMFGLIVWGFQDGGLAGVLGFTPPGAMELSFPLLMFCVAYGLSMDYEVFMLARITEEYRATGDTAAATAAGLQRSAPLITAAGVILAASFAAYATSGVMWLQMVGAGLAVAVLVDITLVRAVLMPAVMRLAGRWNWWAPPPLRAVHARVGLRD